MSSKCPLSISHGSPLHQVSQMEWLFPRIVSAPRLLQVATRLLCSLQDALPLRQSWQISKPVVHFL